MKFALATSVAVLASVVVAQDTSSIPPCILTCGAPLVSTVSQQCPNGLGDIPCLCNTEAFVKPLLECAEKTCDPSILAEKDKLLSSFCPNGAATGGAADSSASATATDGAASESASASDAASSATEAATSASEAASGAAESASSVASSASEAANSAASAASSVATSASGAASGAASQASSVASGVTGTGTATASSPAATTSKGSFASRNSLGVATLISAVGAAVFFL